MGPDSDQQYILNAAQQGRFFDDFDPTANARATNAPGTVPSMGPVTVDMSVQASHHDPYYVGPDLRAALEHDNRLRGDIDPNISLRIFCKIL